MVAILGSGIGPDRAASASITSNNHIDTIAGSTRVLFDGVPAPILSAQSSQIVAIVPYSVAGKTSAQMRVEYNGQASASMTLPVTDLSPAIFTDQLLGKGSPLILNADGSRNSATNPAQKGSIITFFATGEGVLSTLPVDGRLATAPLQTPLQAVTVGVNHAGVQVRFAGAAPGFAGIMQVNAQLDANTPSGAQELIVLVGDKFSPPATVFLQ